MSTWARIQRAFVAPTDLTDQTEQWPADWISYTQHGVRIDTPNLEGHILIPWHNVLRVDHISSPTGEQ